MYPLVWTIPSSHYAIGRHFYKLPEISENNNEHIKLVISLNTARYFTQINKNTHRHGYSFDAEPEKERLPIANDKAKYILYP